jgi:hypothetical protein
LYAKRFVVRLYEVEHCCFCHGCLCSCKQLVPLVSVLWVLCWDSACQWADAARQAVPNDTKRTPMLRCWMAPSKLSRSGTVVHCTGNNTAESRIARCKLTFKRSQVAD